MGKDAGMREFRLLYVEAVPADNAHVVNGYAEVPERSQGIYSFPPASLQEAETPPAVRVNGVIMGVPFIGVGEGEIIGLQIKKRETLDDVGFNIAE